ncbi:FAD:protein FMN transferase [Limimaricola sp.]|uniref:FAD:protein FMN transferase n=1 Tax=Limimaricola sp. TaxID=2211665 RepID=UPI0034474F4E
MSTDPSRHTLDGATMGTRWSAVVITDAAGAETARPALQKAVDAVDAAMSTWKDTSDLMRFNRAPAGEWVDLPADLMTVIRRGLEVGRISGGAFDIGQGETVNAWGFGPEAVNTDRIRAALAQPAPPAYEVLELHEDGTRLRKTAPVALDLSGIAKGFAVDRMHHILGEMGFGNTLVGLDGELRARGVDADGAPWTVAVERPDYAARAAYGAVTLQDAAVATSGDYRHWVQVGPKRLAHTMDPQRGGPLDNGVASTTVMAETCMDADAWATALMVLGPESGRSLAAGLGLSALMILREGDDLCPVGLGPVFAAAA